MGSATDRRVDFVFTSVLEEPCDGLLERRMIVPPRHFARQSPFLQLTENCVDAGRGFAPRPHRGFEIVTLVLEGSLERSAEHGAVRLAAGDAHWLTAGRGCLYGEKAAGRGSARHLQLWLNLPAREKSTAPSSFDQRAASVPVHSFEGGEVRVYAGVSGGLRREHCSCWPLTLLDIDLRSGHEYAATLPAGDRACLYVLRGRASTGGTALRAGDAAWFDPGAGATGPITLDAFSDVRAVLFAAPPIDEPVAIFGPLVMNTMAEIREAYAQYDAGQYAVVRPREAAAATTPA